MRQRVIGGLIIAAVILAGNVAAWGTDKPTQAVQFGTCAGAKTEQYAQVSERSLHVEMRDGVRLAVDVMLPKDLPPNKKLPTVLWLSRYWRGFERGFSLFEGRDFFVRHGYAVVAADVRGSGASFGVQHYPLSKDEVRDFGEVVQWITSQPWSNGKVGTIGTSYDGDTAELAAVSNNPGLKAVIPRFNDFDVFDQTLVFRGGILHEYLLRLWDELVNKLDANTNVYPGEAQQLGGVKPVDADKDHSLLQQAVVEHRKNAPVFAAGKEITYRDDRPAAWGVSMDDFSIHTQRGEIERSNVPILAWGSWLDAATAEGVIDRFSTFRNPQRAIIGPWTHGGGLHASPYQPPNTQADPPVETQLKECLCYYEQFLNGKDDQMLEHVLFYYTLGEEKWKFTKTWPPAGSTTEHWYFDAGNNLSPRQTSQDDRTDTYTIDFQATTGNTNRWWTQMGGAVVYPDRADGDRRLLTYTSSPLAEDKEITGHPVVTLFVSSTASDGAFYVYLEDVDTAGRVTYVTEGELRALHRKLSSDPAPYKLEVPYHSLKRKDGSPLVPGQVAEIEFGLLPTSVLIRKGHRIRVAIAGHDKDTFARIPAEGTPEITVHRGGIAASHIDLPVIRKQ